MGCSPDGLFFFVSLFYAASGDLSIINIAMAKQAAAEDKEDGHRHT